MAGGRLLSVNVGGVRGFDYRGQPAVSAIWKSPVEGRIALQVVQREPEACVFIDDRELHLERASELGIRTIHYTSPERLRHELESLGVEIDQGS